MGRKLDELVHRSAAKAAGVTVIKRFSGGGTVAVDSDTVFATLISSEAAIPEAGACVLLPPSLPAQHYTLHAVPKTSGFDAAASPSELLQSCGRQLYAHMLLQVEAYPRPLMRYTEQLYRHAFGKYGDFRLRENGTLLLLHLT